MEERSRVKQQGNEKHTQRWWWEEIRWSNGCSLDVNLASSYRQSFSWGSACSLQQHEVTGPVSDSIWPYSLFSWGDRVWIRGEKKSQQDPHYSESAPQTQVCVSEGSRHHVCIPARGQDPPPRLQSPEARPVALGGTRWTGSGGSGGGFKRVGDCCICLRWLCCKRLCADLVKGEFSAHLIFTLTLAVTPLSALHAITRMPEGHGVLVFRTHRE